MGGLKWISGPTEDVLLLEEVKQHCRITLTDDDVYLELLTEAVLRTFEQSYRTSVLPTTWQLALDDPPAGRALELVPSPLRSVTWIKSYTDDDVETTMSATGYRVDTYSQPGRVVLKLDTVWPTDLRTANGIIVEYVTGLFAERKDVAADLKAGLLSVIAGLYERREPMSEVTGQRVTVLGGELLAPYRTMRL